MAQIPQNSDFTRKIFGQNPCFLRVSGKISAKINACLAKSGKSGGKKGFRDQKSHLIVFYIFFYKSGKIFFPILRDRHNTRLHLYTNLYTFYGPVLL